jgi:alpha-L-rhamnosidase
MMHSQGTLLYLVAASAAFAAPVRLQCERLENPLGIDSRVPRFSWQSDNPGRNWRQSAYRILVSGSLASARGGQADVWDSGKQTSGASLDIPYAGPKLESRKRYYWTVRVWDPSGQMSLAATPAWWEMGLLAPSDWTAQWIAWKDQSEEDRAGIRWIAAGPSDPPAALPRPSSVFRFHVDIAAAPRDVALFVASTRGFQIRVNGRDLVAKRNWRSFDRQDLTGEITAGPNTIEIAIPASTGGGRGPVPPTDSIAALLKVVASDGAIERYPTGDRWEARLGDQAWTAATVSGEVGSLPLSPVPGNLPQPAALLRHEFTISKPILAARLYVTALGSYRAWIDGRRVGNDVLTPEFTDYKKRVLYQTYDVSGLLKNGRNAIAAMLGDGWFLSGQIENGVRLGFLSPPARLLAQLRIDYTDGTHDDVASDGSWKCAQSPIYHSEIYAGEIYDARLEQPGWDGPGFEDSSWARAVVFEAPPGMVAAEMTTPVRVVATLQPESLKAIANGAYIFDMGQNMVGWPVLRVTGPAGTRVRMRTAEVLNPDGTLYRENLRGADATDTYVLRGSGEEVYRPHFTFQGFRYVELTGFPGTPTPASLAGEVVGSLGGEPSATIVTSSELVNRFWKTGIWGQRGNFLSIPTDCPQRDERQGWTGDAEVFWRTGSYNFDIASFGRQWMRSVVDDQTAEGVFANTVPVVTSFGDGAPGWGDAGVIVPWTAWMQYGDQSILEENWAAMHRWMDFIAANNPNFLRRNRTGSNFADWLPAGSQTPKDLVATAYWALVAGQMAEMAHALGKKSDAERYRQLVAQIRAAFQKEFIRADGTVGSGSQTSYVLALYMKLVPESQVSTVVNNLVKDIEAHGWHLTTGFLGTPFLLFTLADHGRTEVAYRLLLNETYPSWGYMLSKGATTWWERWNGDTGDPAMNSYNHYAFGSVMAWVYRYLAGIDTTANGAGYRQIVIHPRLDARIAKARGEYDSAYGKIVTDWNGAPAGPFALNVTIPPNTTAKVFLPKIAHTVVTEGGKRVKAVKEGDSVVVAVGSGSYAFQVR